MTAAPYACSGVTTYSALKKVEADFNTPIVIFGAGGLGLMALSLLKAMGGKGAIVVDIDARKREAAEKAGALATVDGGAPDALEQLAQKAGGPIRAVIDLVGNAKTTQLGFDCLTKGGKLVIVGLFGGGAPWALPLIPIKAITIQGSYVGNLRETQELLDLVRTKKIAPIPVTPMPLAKGQRGAGRPAEGQAGRTRGADAVGSSSRCRCEEGNDEAIHSFFALRHGLLRGACHRARIRATRWLAMTIAILELSQGNFHVR